MHEFVERTRAATTPASVSRPAGPGYRHAELTALQRSAGNAAVTAMLRVQRDDDPTPDTPVPDTATPDTATIALGPVDSEVALSAQDPISVPARELGDFPTPDPNAPVAQADDDSPHPSADIAVQYPFAYQGTLIYRNLNIAQIKALHLDVGHEPQASLTISPSSGLAVQEAITLVNWHWIPPWHRELEVGLSAVMQQTLMNHPSTSEGGQAQIEQHIVPWFSITVSLSGMYTPPQRSNPGHFDLGPAVGGVIHFP